MMQYLKKDSNGIMLYQPFMVVEEEKAVEGNQPFVILYNAKSQMEKMSEAKEYQLEYNKELEKKRRDFIPIPNLNTSSQANLILRRDKTFYIDENVYGGISIYHDDKETSLTNFTIQAKCIEEHLYRNMVEKYYVFKVKIHQQEKEIRVKEYHIKKMDFIKSQTDMQAAIFEIPGIDTNKVLLGYISKIVVGIPTIKVHLLPGIYFTFNNEPYYVSDNIKIHDAEKKVECRSKKNLYTYSMNSDHKYNMLSRIGEFMKITKNSKIGKVILLHLLLSTMKSIYTSLGEELSTILYIYGSSGTRKTSVAQAAFQVYNTDKPNEFCSLSDTRTKLASVAYDVKDYPLVIDDIYDSSSTYDKKQMDATMDYIIRIVSNGKGRGISNKYQANLKTLDPQSIAVIIGEYLIGNTSTMARYIGVKFEKNTVDLDVLSLFQNDKIFIPTLYKGYIEYMLKNIAFVNKEICVVRKGYRKSIGFDHSRFAEDVSNYWIVIDILMKYLEEEFSLKSTDVGLMKEELREAVLDIVHEHNKKFVANEPYRVFLKYLNEAIDSEEIQIGDEYSFDPQKHSVILREDSMLIRYHEVFSVVKKMLKESNRRFNHSEGKISKSLVEEGVIVTEDCLNNEKTKKIMINGHRVRFMEIKITAMNEILNK